MSKGGGLRTVVETRLPCSTPIPFGYSMEGDTLVDVVLKKIKMKESHKVNLWQHFVIKISHFFS